MTDGLIIGIEELQRRIMKSVKIEVTQQELLLVITLMSDQLFRREFIDPKMPGYKGDPAALAMGVGCPLKVSLSASVGIAKSIRIGAPPHALFR